MHDTKHKFSILRDAQYEALRRVRLSGAVLDIGGSTASGYHELLSKECTVTTANIDPSYGCDLIFDIQKPFPLPDASYDAVLSLNVFEHIFDFHAPFRESARVLKQGGTFVIAVPFMHHIHASPDDFWRYTDSSLRALLEKNGFGSIVITPLGHGIFSLLFQTIGGSFPTALLKSLFKKAAVAADKMLLRLSFRYRQLAERIPLGFFVVAKKN